MTVSEATVILRHRLSASTALNGVFESRILCSINELKSAVEMKSIQIKGGLDRSLTLVVEQHEKGDGGIRVLSCQFFLQALLNF